MDWTYSNSYFRSLGGSFLWYRNIQNICNLLILCWFCSREKSVPFTCCWTCDPHISSHRLSDRCHLRVRPLHKTLSPLFVIYGVCWLTGSGITSVRVTCLSAEVIAARVMPPTWHMRLVSALTAAMPISSRETEGDGSPPTDTHANTMQQTHTWRHHSPLRSQMMAQDWSAFFLPTQHEEIQWSVFSPRVERGRGRKREWAAES